MTGFWSAGLGASGSAIPDSVVDSFEDADLSEYDSAGDFETTTNRAFDGSVSVQSTSDAHQNMRWAEQTIASGDTATVSVRLWTGENNRGGATLVDQNGDGYVIYHENLLDRFGIFTVTDDSLGSQLAQVSTTIPSNEWIRAELRFDGVDTYTAEVFDESGTSLDTTSTTDTTHTPDRHGFHQYDTVEADVLEKSL